MNLFDDLTPLTEYNVDVMNNSTQDIKLVRVSKFMLSLKKNPPTSVFDIIQLSEYPLDGFICLLIAIQSFVLIFLSISKWRIIPSLLANTLFFISLTIRASITLPEGGNDIIDILVIFTSTLSIVLFLFFNVKLNWYGYIGLWIGMNEFQMIYSFVDHLAILVCTYCFIAIYLSIHSKGKSVKIISLLFILNQILLLLPLHWNINTAKINITLQLSSLYYLNTFFLILAYYFMYMFNDDLNNKTNDDSDKMKKE